MSTWLDGGSALRPASALEGTIFKVAEATGDATGAQDAGIIAAAIAAAKAEGGGIVQASSGQVYQVASQGSTAIRNPSGSTGTRNRVIALPDNVIFDGNGSALKLVGSECSMFLSESVAGIGCVLSSGLAVGSPITTLAVTALVTAIPSGSKLVAYTAGANSKRQVFTASASASIGATSVSILSTTPSFAFPSGTGLAVRGQNLGLRNVIFDNNGVSFSTHTTLQLGYIDGLELTNVKLTNGIRANGWIYDTVGAKLDNLEADGMQGQAWTLGDPLATGLGHNGVYNAKCGRLYASNITLFDTASSPGNPYNLVVYSSSIALLHVKDCSGGIKLQQPSTDVTIGMALQDGVGELSALQGAFKIQGDTSFPAGLDRPTRINVGQVIVRNCVNTGLYMYHGQDCSVGSYIGYKNVGLHTAFSDVVLAGGINDHIGHIVSDQPGGGGVQLTADAAGNGPVNFSLPSIKVRNPGQLSTTLSSGLSTGGPITSLPVAAMPTTITTGKAVIITDGTHTQQFVTSGTTVQGATSITVASLTPTFAFPSGTQVLLSGIRSGVRGDTTYSGSFGEIEVIDDQAVHTMDRGFNGLVSTTSVATIDKFTSTGHTDVPFFSASTSVGTRNIADTSGATLAALEAEVNKIKAMQRASGAWI